MAEGNGYGQKTVFNQEIVHSSIISNYTHFLYILYRKLGLFALKGYFNASYTGHMGQNVSNIISNQFLKIRVTIPQFR